MGHWPPAAAAAAAADDDDDDDDDDSDVESATSFTSDDEDSSNRRQTPYWQEHRQLLHSRGFRLNTARNVRQYYEAYWANNPDPHRRGCAEYQRARALHPDALCGDPGLPDNLFRGQRVSDGKRIIVKAVCLRSREAEIMRCLSTAPLRNDPRNHCIPVVDIIPVPSHNITLIVMEEWSSELIPDAPCCLHLFLNALQSCITHMVFMHEHHIAHLDISLRNLVTDYNGHYACINYELSQSFAGIANPRICTLRATEVPPELERGESSDPFKVDVWAMGILMLRAGHLTNNLIPELIEVIQPMLNEHPSRRPNALTVLRKFDEMIPKIHPSHLSCQINRRP
ncbi:kinase-like domain-containing protein [Vararia minispora EC-137]|uniref:Kinase-like domain-containing protein n=1 Tax=Vararia minispora EC-137 TaxID=1314806 RepID=A0ACB8QTC3_9AGAM|nr:kinase-like domain-containing protein [Vararia minispora EC-137]